MGFAIKSRDLIVMSLVGCGSLFRKLVAGRCLS